MNHFVVLKSVDGSGAVIHDPAIGRRWVSRDEMSRRFTGVVLEATPTPSFRPRDERQQVGLRNLMGRPLGLRRGLLQLFLLGIALQVCLLLFPLFLQWSVDEAVFSADRDLLTVMALAVLGVVGIQAAIIGVRTWAATVIGIDLNFQWLNGLFAHMVRLPLSFFERRHLGDIVSRFGSVLTIQRTLTTQFVEAFIDGILVVTTLAMMLIYSGKLALVVLCAAGAYVLIRGLTYASLRQLSAEQIVHSARQHSLLLESIRGMQAVRLFNKGEDRRMRWANALADQFQSEISIGRISVSNQTAHALCFGAQRVAVVWGGASLVIDSAISIGMLFAFISYQEQFNTRIGVLIDRVVEFRLLRLHSNRVADIATAETEPRNTNIASIDLSGEPEIELRNVSYRFGDGEQWIIKDVTLAIQAGQVIAITGMSGSGKTTLLRVMLGLLTPTSGEVYFRGRRINDIGLDNYRALLGTVMQEDTLFSGSIADNISFFDTNPDLRLVERCARVAAVHDEIRLMPMGYNTLIGDIGTGLSGGQRQRILLARALFRGPKVLALDEATSHLDIDNERSVNAAIADLALTRIVVAHRSETIQMADRVIVLEKGRVVLDGSPSDRVTGPAQG